jgi:hypothetical protein
MPRNTPAPKGTGTGSRNQMYSGPLDEVNLLIDSETSKIEIRKVAVTEKNDVWSIRIRNKTAVTSIK